MATLQGFRDWATTKGFPEGARLSYIAPDIFIELSPLKPMLEIPTAAIATLQGFRDWATSDDFPDGVRISFIGQELFIEMSPEELNKHNPIKFEISSIIGQFVKRHKLGRFFMDGTLLTNDLANLSTEPDGIFASWESIKSGRVQLVPRKFRPGEAIELQGTPDWVFEVVSLRSKRKDTKVLRETYHRAGIPEYWLINALDEDLNFQLLRHQPEGYVAEATHDGWLHSHVFGIDVRLVQTRDELDTWQYTLEIADRP
ncbi:MAG: Uma2 family endonuclease [Planctomycetes bacterium]|nr:Uma2 family endonuclease [Planctomycetota bacterium]